MTRNVPAIGAIAHLHWRVTTNYRLRAISFAIMFASIVLYGWSKNYGALLWTVRWRSPA